MSKKPVIVFEGIEGSGKSYHLNNVSNFLKKRKIDHIKLLQIIKLLLVSNVVIVLPHTELVNRSLMINTYINRAVIVPDRLVMKAVI